ncbi:neuropeptide Y receptor type 4-2 isoform X2 [Manis javanica]|uniref:neuropeptide Y receptor type 4-2 isoform X2 n=1 Tax=Manis javanica TaxID=9974 RepID=UPI0008138DCB|nr:neuropeptide Y receptor type 4-2 isoform X2 [Manis javanica]KAI5942401.1 Neuropeptide Y receptor type 4 [Manis javanica]
MEMVESRHHHCISWNSLTCTMNISHILALLLPGSPQGQNSSKSKGTPYNFSDHCQDSVDPMGFIITSYSIETIVGVLGNLCLICVTIRQKEKANVTNLLIANLAFSDFLLCLICQPLTAIYTIMDYWVFGEALCKMSAFIQCMSVTVSIFSLVLVALERHQLIINPTGWKPSVFQAYLGIIAIWLIACCLSLPFMANSVLENVFHRNHSKAVKFLEDKAVCTESWPVDHHRIIYTTFLLLFQYCIPLAFILVCYVRIYQHLQKRRQVFCKGTYSSRAWQMKRINGILVAMVAAFAVLWLPLHVFNTLEDWYQEAIPICHGNLIFLMCHLLAMASTCVNPFIYGFLNTNFKKEVKAVVLTCQQRTPVKEYEHLPLSTVHTDVSKGSLRLSDRSNPI